MCPGLVARRGRQPTLGCPTRVAIKDDSQVTGKGSGRLDWTGPQWQGMLRLLEWVQTTAMLDGTEALLHSLMVV